MYPALKTFFHEAYNRKLNASDLQTTSSALGHAPTHNMYNFLGIEDKDSNTVGSTARNTRQRQQAWLRQCAVH